jgi:hypothetical protein
MIYRTLQINRHINIKLLREQVDGTENLRRSFAGVAGALHNNGCVTGEPGGIDPNGRSYKNWILASPEKIKRMLKLRRIKPLYPEALDAIRIRGKEGA